MPIRVGIIGLGHGAAVHIPSFKFNPRYELAAVCARTPGKAAQVARDNGIPRWFTDARELIRSDVDLVSIASPAATHAGLAAAALAAGKHTIVEIGFTPCTEDARVLDELARQRRRVGAAAFVLHYAPGLRLVSDLLKQKQIGQPRLMRFELFSSLLVDPQQGRFRWMWDAANGGGIMANTVSHAFDLALRWFGPVREVDASLRTFADVTGVPKNIALADDTGAVTLHFESGVLATFTYSAVVAAPRMSMEIHGSQASLLIDGFGDEMSILRHGDTAPQALYPPEAYLEATRGWNGLQGGFIVFTDQLASAIADGAKPPELPTFHDGWKVARLLDAARLSSREGRRVKVADIR